MYEFLTNPFVTFFFLGFGAWIITLILSSKFAIKMGQWVDDQIEEEG